MSDTAHDWKAHGAHTVTDGQDSWKCSKCESVVIQPNRPAIDAVINCPVFHTHDEFTDHFFTCGEIIAQRIHDA